MRRACIEIFHVLTNMDTAEVLTATWHSWSKFCQMSVATDRFFCTLQIHHHRMIDFQIRKCTLRTTIFYNYFQISDNTQTRWDTYSSWKFIKLVLQKISGIFRKSMAKKHWKFCRILVCQSTPWPCDPRHPESLQIRNRIWDYEYLPQSSAQGIRLRSERISFRRPGSSGVRKPVHASVQLPDSWWPIMPGRQDLQRGGNQRTIHVIGYIWGSCGGLQKDIFAVAYRLITTMKCSLK